jgi:hypothetical protein
MAEFGIGGTGKTWVAEAQEPLALAERMGVRRMKEQQAAERGRIQLSKQKQAQEALEQTIRNKSTDIGGFDAGLYSAPFQQFQTQKMKELAAEMPKLSTPELVQKANLLKVDLQNTATKLKNASEAATKQISGLPTEFYDPAQVQRELQNQIESTYKPGDDLFAYQPQAEDEVQKAKSSYRNIRGGNIGNKVVESIGKDIEAQGSKNKTGGGFDIKTQIPLGFSKDKNGVLVPDAETFNGLFQSQTGGKEYVTSFEQEALQDPKNPFTVLKTGLDKQLQSGNIDQTEYNKAMSNNRFANVIVPNLGELQGLISRFDRSLDVNKFASQLTEDARKKLEYRKPPTESEFPYYIPGGGKGTSYKSPRLTVTLPDNEQGASERLTLGDAKVYDKKTGQFRVLTSKETIDYGKNNGLSDNKIDLVPEIVVREKQNFKAVDARGNVVALKYNPNRGETFDPVELAKEFDKVGGVKLIGYGGKTYPTLDSFLSNQNAISVNTMFRVNTTMPGQTKGGSLRDPVPPLFFTAKQKPELLRRWNDYSTKPYDVIVKEWESLPIKALNQYRGRPSDY